MEEICLEEQDSNEVEIYLTTNEFKILKEKYSKQLNIYPTTKPDIFTISTKLKSYSGFIVLPRQIIIIKPKVKNASVLLMLTYAFKHLQLENEEISFPENKNIHQILIKILVKRIENLIEEGLNKSYTEVEENLPYIRGKIIITKQLQENMILKYRTFCRFPDLTFDIMENQIIKFTLYQIIKYHHLSGDLDKLVVKLYHALALVSLREITYADFSKIQYTRINDRYRSILKICEILLRNSSIEVDKLGNYESFAFLLDMNILFEDFVREYLKAELIEYNVQKEYDHLDIDHNIEIEPDIVIRKKGKAVLIIDTKYKILDSREIIKSDVSQILDYCLVYNIRNGILLYPKMEMEFYNEYSIKNIDIKIKVKTIDISNSVYLPHLVELINKISESIETNTV
jgi:5-methylcytosine-specific restriction enzyme subunit McrC